MADYVSKKLAPSGRPTSTTTPSTARAWPTAPARCWRRPACTTVANDAIDPRSQDFSAVVNRLSTANPDLIFYGGYYSEAGRLRKQLVDDDVRARFLSGDGGLDQGFITAAGAAGAEGAQLTCACKLATEDAGGKLGDFAKNYKAAQRGGGRHVLHRGLRLGQHPDQGDQGRQDRPPGPARLRGEPGHLPGRRQGHQLRGQRQHQGHGRVRLRGQGRRSSPSWAPPKSSPASSRPSTPASPVCGTSSGPRRSTG